MILSRMNFWVVALTGFTMVFATGCDDDDVDHRPPPGKGALVVDNNSVARFQVFVDGEDRGRAGSFKQRAVDLDPGVYRVVLDEDDGDRSFRDDIDVLEGRTTVLDVSAGNLGNRLDVRVFLND